MKAALEREVKLRPGPGFRGIELDGRPIAVRELVSAYHDTDDLRLARAGITLRRRVADSGDAVWQLKLPRETGRCELKWPAPDHRVPGDVRSLLLAHTRGRPLSAVATLRTERSGVVVTDAGTDLAEVVEDRVDVLGDGGVVDTFEEIEVELVDGDAGSLERLETLLRDAGARTSDGRPKVFRALGEAVPAGRRVKAKGRRGVLARGLAEQYEELLAHDPGTRLGTDPEALHDHRVAIRRLRALLRAGRPLLDRAWADELRDSLKRAGHALAQARDLDVLIERIESDRSRLPEPERTGAGDVLAALRDRRARAQEQLLADISEPWYLSTLNRLEVAVADPRFAGSGSLRRGVRRRHRQARKLIRTLPDHPSDAQLHALRRAVRNARYAAELAAAGGVRRTRGYAKRAKAFQDVLGGHQDAVVATAALADIDGEVTRPSAHMACAALAEIQAERRADARGRIARGWKRLDARAP
jgi:CHAD domain-containing protein